MISFKAKIIGFKTRKVSWYAFINAGYSDGKIFKKVENGSITGWRIWRLSAIRIVG